MARSSTINQPMAMRPLTVVMALRSSSAFSSTTVLATDRLRPSTSPAPTLQPHASARPRPMLVASTIWPMAPRITTRRTAMRSATEKCRPTPNISSMTPISANWPAITRSATKPGVKGHRHPRDEVADQRGQAQAMREEAEEERQDKTNGDRGNERDIMRHESPLYPESTRVKLCWPLPSVLDPCCVVPHLAGAEAGCGRWGQSAPDGCLAIDGVASVADLVIARQLVSSQDICQEVSERMVRYGDMLAWHWCLLAASCAPGGTRLVARVPC